MATASSPRATVLPENVLSDILLLETDGVPLETFGHRAEINLLIESVSCFWGGRTDYYVGGNMFIYYSKKQARTLEYRGPDFFVVKGVDGTRPRDFWVVWEEDGRYPNLIIEILSPTTAKEDRTTKKALYEETFRTPEFFCFDPYTNQLEGWRLAGQQHYQPIAPEGQGLDVERAAGMLPGNVGRELSKPHSNVVAPLRCTKATHSAEGRKRRS